MSRHVQRTLAALGIGAIAQRGALLLISVVLGHALGTRGFGRYSLAVALGMALAAFAGTGIRSVVSRAAVREPERLGGWLGAAVRLRAAITLMLLPLVGLAAFGLSKEPLLWCTGALIALPLAWDQKGLLDAAGRAAHEVAIELAATAVHVLATLALLACGCVELVPLVAVHLASRGLYAVLAHRAVLRLPGRERPARAGTILREARVPAITQTVVGFLQNGDVWLVRWLGGESAAGLYAVAMRIAATAALPASQLARMLLPHNTRAAAHAGSFGTAMRSLRSAAFAIVPLVFGGMVAAGPLCGLWGAEFQAAAPALRTLLAAVAMQQIGWVCAQILYAHDRLRPWAIAQWAGAAAQVGSAIALVPEFGATGGAVAALLGNGIALLGWYAAMARRLPIGLGRSVVPSFGIGMAVAAAAFAAAPLGLVAQLAAGGLACAAGLYWVELRHTWRRLGAGLSGASGFGG